jgi:SAM-dependent methyltransferase
MQDLLKKLMQGLGQLVEKIAALFEKKGTKGGKTAPVEGIAAKPTGISLPEGRLRKVLEAIECREVLSLIPNLSGKTALHSTTSEARVWDPLVQKGAKTIVDFDVSSLEESKLPTSPRPGGLQLVKGSFTAPPFRDDSFEFLLLFGTGARRSNPTLWIEEMARLLKEGARVVVSFIHPYLEHQLNPRAGFPNGIDRYYMALRRAGIYVEEIKEAAADDSLRSFFGPTKNDLEFAQIKGCPMVVFFKAIRLKRK